MQSPVSRLVPWWAAVACALGVSACTVQPARVDYYYGSPPPVIYRPAAPVYGPAYGYSPGYSATYYWEAERSRRDYREGPPPRVVVPPPAYRPDDRRPPPPPVPPAVANPSRGAVAPTPAAPPPSRMGPSFSGRPGGQPPAPRGEHPDGRRHDRD